MPKSTWFLPGRVLLALSKDGTNCQSQNLDSIPRSRDRQHGRSPHVCLETTFLRSETQRARACVCVCVFRVHWSARRSQQRTRALVDPPPIRVPGFGFRVSGFGFRVSGSGFQVPGFGFRDSTTDQEGPTPTSTRQSENMQYGDTTPWRKTGVTLHGVVF